MTNEEITTAFIWLSRRYEEITPLTYIKREDQYAFLFDKDNKQLILEKVEEIDEAVKIIETLMAYGNIRPINGVIYPEGSHEEILKRANQWLCKYRS